MAVTDQAPSSVGVRNVVGGAHAAGVAFGPDVLVADFIQWVQTEKVQTQITMQATTLPAFCFQSWRQRRAWAKRALCTCGQIGRLLLIRHHKAGSDIEWQARELHHSKRQTP